VSATPDPIDTPTVKEALAAFPRIIATRFAHDYPQVTASEIFKRINFESSSDGTTFYGIEGLSIDERIELDAVFSEDASSIIASDRNEVLDVLPTDIAIAFDALYPGVEIDEIAMSSNVDGLAYAVLFIRDGEELEVNLDSGGIFVSLENVLEDNEIPPVIEEVVLSQNVDMPDVEYEEVTLADDSIEYVVEFENDDGESISYRMDALGEILQIDFEGPIPNVGVALEDFPSDIISSFTESYPEVTASEIFKRISFKTDPEGIVFYGIEGVSADESIGLDAIYSDDVTLVETNREDVLDELPADIAEAFSSLYPGVEIEEIVQSTNADDTTYAILFIQDDKELETNLDSKGTFIALENVLDEDETPALIVNAAADLNVAMPDVEFEEVTLADGSTIYVVEFENDRGESISYQMDANGETFQIDFEGPIPNVGIALEDFPEEIALLFATNYPEVTASEIFVRIDFESESDATMFYGIEGVSPDERVEIDAVFTEGINLVDTTRQELLDVLPADIAIAFDALYPGVEIDEIAQSTNSAGTSYAVLFIQDGEELEANLDEMGNFVSLENVLDEDQVPADIAESAEAKRVAMPDVEFEEVTFADGSTQYVVEFENNNGESISYRMSGSGSVLQLDFEGLVTN